MGVGINNIHNAEARMLLKSHCAQDSLLGVENYLAPNISSAEVEKHWAK
jgi:hypothetical protein